MTDLYQDQRAMRMNMAHALRRGIVAVLDAGTCNTSCLIVRLGEKAQGAVVPLAGKAQPNPDYRVVGAATERSRGVYFGEVTSIKDMEITVRSVISRAQKMAGVRVDHVIACFSGGLSKSDIFSGRVELAGESVSEVDIANLLGGALPDIGDDKTLLHAQPLEFVLDGRGGLRDPRGQEGRVLEGHLHAVVVRLQPLRNLLSALDSCGLKLAGVASSAYSSSLSALVEDEQALGSACIDMGDAVTGISVFYQKQMIYVDSVRIGGRHVTSDISKGLNIPVAMAERLKTFSGGVHATGQDNREEISLNSDSGDWDEDSRSVSRADLIGIIRPRVEEILEAVHSRLEAMGFSRLEAQRVVLTGGGSGIPGLVDLANNIFGQQVRLGRPQRLLGCPSSFSGPSASAAVGLCLSATSPQDEIWDFHSPAVEGEWPMGRFLRWFKSNW